MVKPVGPQQNSGYLLERLIALTVFVIQYTQGLFLKHRRMWISWMVHLQADSGSQAPSVESGHHSPRPRRLSLELSQSTGQRGNRKNIKDNSGGPGARTNGGSHFCFDWN